VIMVRYRDGQQVKEGASRAFITYIKRKRGGIHIAGEEETTYLGARRRCPRNKIYREGGESAKRVPD